MTIFGWSGRPMVTAYSCKKCGLVVPADKAADHVCTPWRNLSGTAPTSTTSALADPQILHHEAAFLDAQDAVLTVFGDGDQIAGFPVADGEFHGAEWLPGLGFELVAVQHSGSVTL